MIAIAYLRRSKKSDERTVSLDEQRRAVLEYAEKNGFHLNGARCIVDDGISGGKRERLDRISAFMKASDAQVVIVYHQDRFARDVAGFLDTLALWDRKGFELHVCGRGRISIAEPEDFMVNGTLALAAEFQRRITGKNVRRTLAIRKVQGQRYSGKPPLGYRFRDGGQVWTKKRGMVTIWKLEPDPKTAPILACLTDLHQRGVGIRPAARELGLGVSTVQAVYRRLAKELQRKTG